MPTQPQKPARKIGTLNESPLHAALKQWYARPDDRLEVPVDGFIVDIVRRHPLMAQELLVEIQTGYFSSIKQKLTALTANHPVRLVYPIAREKWLVKLPKDEQSQPHRRKSPKHGAFEHVFEELVSFPELLLNPNFAIEVLLTHEEEVRRYVGKRAWRRRGWVTEERRLLEVVERRLFETPADLTVLLPPDLAEPFTTADLAAAASRRRRLAQKMAYCLREMGVIAPVGKQGNAFLYARGDFETNQKPKTSSGQN
jgi:hypothetical protein